MNPLMHDWNMLQVLYCDGASWTGSNSSTTIHEGKQLYFRGKNNLDALIDDLLTNRGMAQATEVVISGGSAGVFCTELPLCPPQNVSLSYPSPVTVKRNRGVSCLPAC